MHLVEVPPHGRDLGSGLGQVHLVRVTMARAANDVMQSIIFSAVLDSLAALKRASGGLPNQLLRGVQAIHPNVTFADLPKELQDQIVESTRGAFTALLKEGYDAAAALEEKMATVEEEGNSDAAVELNKQTQEVYKSFQDALVGLNFEPEVVIKHELYQSNVEALDNTIAALEKGNIQKAYDEYLWAVDWAWYYMNFDEETCNYLENQLFDNRDGTWGADLIKYRHCDIGGVVKSLGAKYDEEGADVSSEIAKLKELRATEQERLDKTLAEEKEGLEKTIKLMQKYSK
jgi:hypothetical protein